MHSFYGKTILGNYICISEIIYKHRNDSAIDLSKVIYIIRREIAYNK